MWDTTAQVTLLRVEGKNEKNGVSGEVGRKLKQNCARLVRFVYSTLVWTGDKIVEIDSTG